MSELENVISDLKLANRRREDDAQRVRDDVQGLKDSIPRAMNAQKDLTDGRLRDLNSELKSLKTLLSQRMNSAAPAAPPAATPSPSFLKPASGSAAPNPAAAGSSSPITQSAIAQDESKESAKTPEETPGTTKTYNDYVSSIGRSSPFSSGMPAGKAAIPSWQLAMQSKNSSANTAGDVSTSNPTEAKEV